MIHVLLLLLACGATTAEIDVETALVDVQTSGWSGEVTEAAPPPRELSMEETAAAEVVEEQGVVSMEDPYPELNWERAGGAIFDPAGGMYLDQIEVLVYSLMGTGASVHYTVDGSEPTNQSSTFLTKLPFTGEGDYTVKACVSAPERRDSVVVEQVYRIRTASAAPSVSATLMDPESPESGNTTHANELYLGSFEDGVRLTFYTSTPNSDIAYTFDGQDPTDDYGNRTANGAQLLLTTFGNTTVKTKTFPRDMSGFPSEIATYTVEVHKRPPRPAYTFRRERIFLKDMLNKYKEGIVKAEKEVLTPAELETYILDVLNPDDGQCDDCVVSNDELELIKDAAWEMKVYEGLATDASIPLYAGFLMRGSCHRFIHTLNTQMREYRWKQRNGTGLALPSGTEHDDGEISSVMSS